MFVSLEPGFALRLPGLGSHADPFQLAVERFLPGRRRAFFFRQPVPLLLEPRGVVPFPRNAPAAVEFQNPAGHVVEKIAIVRHRDHRAGIFRQMPLEPVDRLGVEMVRRLVEQQQIGPLQQNLAQRHAPPLAAGELRHIGIAGRQVHRIHRDFDLPVEFPGIVHFDLVLHAGLLGQQLFHLVGARAARQAGR